MVWTLLHSRLHQCLQRRFPELKASRILVAVSGGQDSLCLLHLLNDLTKQWQWHLAVAHCDHHWPTDEGIADHVQRLAQGYKLPYFQRDAQDLPQTEAAARHWRYQALTAIARAENFPVVMTGHTQSDRAETLLFNLVRGSGSDGLQSMGWIRELADLDVAKKENFKIRLVRPLLDISRQETGDFCQQQKLSIWADVLNEKLAYRRNRIRGELIPYLRKHFNPQVEKKLAQTVELLTAEVAYLEQITGEIYQTLIQSDQKSLDRRRLSQQPLALQRRIIRCFLQSCQTQAPNFEQIEQIVALINAPNGSQTSSLPSQGIIRVEGDFLHYINGEK
ncbi:MULTISPECIES: tRNA lysidine(34) synthetase TilS [unclassified Synechocystis]|uniref:tRNA lysidine(34) synthetase TilS n=1 Tax=unclassified Synechocystis TaxID=2640012 RepID=UPI000424D091|nr:MULTISPECIES: tRNA lysidine(34) synthetase TilS [unclassified Synechocystis]AIE75866.1 tRNA(Ile)-lysidine synthetase [Synechocystis sp. PCC 6714]MCT0255206.1 tRNA lysidine(34) synthetase TilS [Synechocystis sp. CS-94]